MYDLYKLKDYKIESRRKHFVEHVAEAAVGCIADYLKAEFVYK